MTQESDPFAQLEKKDKVVKRASRGAFFFVNYIFVAAIIFAALLVFTNYSAYAQLLNNHLFPNELEQTEERIQESLTQIEEEVVLEVAPTVQSEGEERTDDQTQRMTQFLQKHLSRQQVSVQYEQYSPGNLVKDVEIPSISTAIYPYDNRVVIPKIGKNIPLVNVENREASSSHEWHQIFLDELENGVIKYP